jgi:23S rRNA pseudouridine2605 synthase
MTSRNKEKDKKQPPRVRPPKGTPPLSQRVNRILSASGITSRRKADELIKEGRVSVNGRIITEPGAQAVWGVDRIVVDGRAVPDPAERLYLMLNKPFGYVSALSDPDGRPVVSELVKDVGRRVYPVGRLDYDTLGLLLFTDDGEWAYRLTHPRFHVPKTYKVDVAGAISDSALEALRKGVPLEDGFSGAAKITLVQRNARASVLRMTITRGRRRLLRRMLEAVGYDVIHLIRIGFGVLELGDLKIGQYRHLEPSEVESMKKMVGLL